MLQYVTDKHIRYIIVRYHIEKVRPGEIHAELIHPDALAIYGISPIPELTLRYLYRRIPRIPNTTIEMVKQEWLNGLLDVPLANKRVRLEELTKLYDKETNTTIKYKLLEQIRIEVGEEHWQKALEGSGKTTINLHEELKSFLTHPEEINENENL